MAKPEMIHGCHCQVSLFWVANEVVETASEHCLYNVLLTYVNVPILSQLVDNVALK